MQRHYLSGLIETVKEELKTQSLSEQDKEKIRVLRIAVDQGDADAQTELGWLYRNGEGVPQDDKEAARLFALAAEQGCASAQNNLGRLYREGQGMPQDDKKAAQLYRLAADQGWASAQQNLGQLYENGFGVKKDIPEAVHLYRLAAEQKLRAGSTAIQKLFYDKKTNCLEVTYHAAVMFAEEEMLEKLARYSAKKLANLFFKNPEDLDKVERLLPVKLAKEVNTHLNELFRAHISKIENTLSCPKDVARIIFSYQSGMGVETMTKIEKASPMQKVGFFAKIGSALKSIGKQQASNLNNIKI